MSGHLAKAKAALEAARDLDVDLGEVEMPKRYHRLLDLAQVQAAVAQAEALERIAGALESPPGETYAHEMLRKYGDSHPPGR